MPVHMRTRTGLQVTFHRDGEEVESEVASTGERARKIGLLMLARLDDLHDGDRLTVTEVR